MRWWERANKQEWKWYRWRVDYGANFAYYRHILHSTLVSCCCCCCYFFVMPKSKHPNCTQTQWRIHTHTHTQWTELMLLELLMRLLSFNIGIHTKYTRTHTHTHIRIHRRLLSVNTTSIPSHASSILTPHFQPLKQIQVNTSIHSYIEGEHGWRG